MKQNLLKMNSLPNSTWVETGTYLGETSIFLSKFAKQVYTIEPFEPLFKQAQIVFSNYKNIKIYNNSSEEIFESIIEGIDTDNICFWLDGHFSGEGTFEGNSHCPIEFELNIIEMNLKKFKNIKIFIDDVRLFGNDPAYPTMKSLVERIDRMSLKWKIEKDILIISNLALV
jgi:hypothetical protein